jgi:hypothetical protein
MQNEKVVPQFPSRKQLNRYGLNLVLEMYTKHARLKVLVPVTMKMAVC